MDEACVILRLTPHSVRTVKRVTWDHSASLTASLAPLHPQDRSTACAMPVLQVRIAISPAMVKELAIVLGSPPVIVETTN